MLKIYYEDKYLVVCEKTAGRLSEGEGNDCLPRLLADHFEAKGEQNAIYTVHRLDRETSGLMVYARTKNAAATLSSSITDGTFEKEYLARVPGVPTAASGKMEDLLFYDRTKNRSYTVQRMRKGVKDASLEYKVLSEKNGISLVRIKLLTGRTHQIRVQFASRGMPLVCDRKYGAPKGEGAIILRACRLSIPLPVTKEKMHFETEDARVAVDGNG